MATTTTTTTATTSGLSQKFSMSIIRCMTTFGTGNAMRLSSTGFRQPLGLFSGSVEEVI